MNQFATDLLHAGLTGAITFVVVYVALFFLPLHLLPSWDVSIVLALSAFTRKLIG